MYDMYPWSDRPRPAAPAPRDGRHPMAAGDPDRAETAPAEQAGPPAEARQAVQVALDRRDNGGDAVGAVSPATSGRPRQ